MNKTLTLICVLFSMALHAQTIEKPNFAGTTHPSLNVDKIEMLATATVFYMTIENPGDNEDWFCADKNIYLQHPVTLQKYPITKSEGIPTCPDAHKFTKKGQKLSFKLYFGKIPASTNYINLIEDCNNYCFTIKGIITNTAFNNKVANAFTSYARKADAEAALFFEEAVILAPDYPYGVIYFNLVKIYSETGNSEKLLEWYQKLSQSNVVDKAYYLDIIKTRKLY